MSEAKLRNGGVVSYHQTSHHHYALNPVPLDLSQKSSRLKQTNGNKLSTPKTKQNFNTNTNNNNNLMNTDIKTIINELANKKVNKKAQNFEEEDEEEEEDTDVVLNEQVANYDDENISDIAENEAYDEYNEEENLPNNTNNNNIETDNFSTGSSNLQEVSQEPCCKQTSKKIKFNLSILRQVQNVKRIINHLSKDKQTY